MHLAPPVFRHRGVENGAKHLEDGIGLTGRRVVMPRLLPPVVLPLRYQEREGGTQVRIAAVLEYSTLLLGRMHG